VLISIISKRQLFDGLLFDSIIFLVFPLTMLYLGAGDKFSGWQWTGLGLVVAGMLAMRWGQ